MANTRAKRRKIGAVVYGILLVIYMLLLAAVAVYFLGNIWTLAEEYEASRPNIVMDEYIEGLRENLWNDSMSDTIASMRHEFQTDEECAAIVKSMFEDEIRYIRKSGGGDADTEAVYDIVCGEHLIGKATMVRDESAASQLKYTQASDFIQTIPVLGSKIGDSIKMNLLPWKVESDEFYFDGLYSSAQITVPASYTVRLNNIQLNDEYIVDDGIHYDILEPYYADYPSLPTKVTYRADYIIGMLDMVAYDEDGNETVIDDTLDDWQFIPQPDEYEFERLDEFAYNFADAFLAFSSNAMDFGSSFAKVQPYLVSGGELEARLRLSADGAGWAHTQSYRMESCTLNSAIALGNGIYVLDITAQTLIYYPGKGTDGTVRNLNGLTVTVEDDGSRIVALDVERSSREIEG